MKMKSVAGGIFALFLVTATIMKIRGYDKRQRTGPERA
jgi:hypothetical protein